MDVRRSGIHAACSWRHGQAASFEPSGTFTAVIPAQAGIQFQRAVRSTQKDFVSFGRGI
jgi:hypothetical protein